MSFFQKRLAQAHAENRRIAAEGSDKTAARMVRDSKRRLAKTNLGKLQALQSERERWERKQTIATNKLRAVRRQIEALAEVMARATVETEWTGETSTKGKQ